MGFITLARFCNNSDDRYIGSTIGCERLLYHLLTTTQPDYRRSMVGVENKRGVFCNDDSSKNSLNCVNLSHRALVDNKMGMDSGGSRR